MSYSSQLSVGNASLDLRAKFNAFFEEARAIDRVVNPHPMLRMPLDIIREIFEAATRSDPDLPALLTETCQQWRALALETPGLWSNNKVAFDDEDALEALPLALLLSRNLPLDIVLTGVRAPRSLLDEFVPHTGRIRSLEVLTYKQASEPFRVLSRTSPDGFSRLSRLSIEDCRYNAKPEEVVKDSPLYTLERARLHENTLDEVDLKAVESLSMLSSLTALVINAARMTTSVPFQLPSVKSLRLAMKDTPSLLQHLTCDLLETLDVVVDDLSRKGWWDVLHTSLAYPRLESLAIDVTLARAKNDWSKPWTARDLPRLPTHQRLSRIIVTLSFADRRYEAAGESNSVEYLCGDMLNEFIASVPLLTDLRLLHVPLFHAPFIWPMPQILQSLRKLELQVPGIVYEQHGLVIVLPNLSDLRYYGYIAPESTQLPTLRTPFLEHLEIMHHIRSIHPLLAQIDRQWLDIERKPIGHPDYSVALANSSKDFPEELPQPKETDRLFPVIHQSRALRELRLHLGNIYGRDPIFTVTRFPDLRVLYCSVSFLFYIDAPQLEELHLLWFRGSRDESVKFNAYPKAIRFPHTFSHVRLLDFYGHVDRRYNEGAPRSSMKLDGWVPYMDALETIILPRSGGFIDRLTELLSKNPQICPRLTTIDSFAYPWSWFAFRDCLEDRNHLAMRDHRIQVIHSLRFPLTLHRNISDRLKEVLSGRFAAPFEAVPLQPWAIEELIPPSEREKVGERPEHICFGCLQSGNAFGCFGPSSSESEFRGMDCQRHQSRRPDRGAMISAYVMSITGYLEY